MLSHIRSEINQARKVSVASSVVLNESAILDQIRNNIDKRRGSKNFHNLEGKKN